VRGLDPVPGQCSDHPSQLLRRHLYVGYFDADEFRLLWPELLAVAGGAADGGGAAGGGGGGSMPLLALLGAYGFPRVRARGS
jgi:hypothetical protein